MENTGTQMCLVDIDSVRDMALINMAKVWRYGSDDYCLNDMGWKFQFNDRKRALGLCNYRTRTICLSTYLLDNTQREMSGWENTMIHEIAHAINHHLGGRGHDRQWRNIFLHMGGNGERCSSDAKKIISLDKPTSKYTLKCKEGHLFAKHKMAKGRISFYSCPKCTKAHGLSGYQSQFPLEVIKNY